MPGLERATPPWGVWRRRDGAVHGVAVRGGGTRGRRRKVPSSVPPAVCAVSGLRGIARPLAAVRARSFLGSREALRIEELTSKVGIQREVIMFEK